MRTLLPRDVVWRLLERLREQEELLTESLKELSPRKHGDLVEAIDECRRLTRTQVNVLNRVRRRYD